MTTKTTLTIGTPVTAKKFGGGGGMVEGVVSDIVASKQGEWIMVTLADGSVIKTRPSMATAK